VVQQLFCSPFDIITFESCQLQLLHLLARMVPPPLPLLLLLVSAVVADPLPDAVAVAPAGTFTGYEENGTKVWRGVPYAEPPVGTLRWMPTVMKAALDAPLETKAFGADCAQIGPGWPSLGGMVQHCDNPMMGCPNMSWSNATKEDCLFLNVYAPAKSADPEAGGFPVVVYFPAGAFQWGAGNDAENNGYHKSTTPGWKDTVFVSANYRAGIFGFLASPSLSKRSGTNSSGLFGVHDQTMVLKWVQENIAAFGGDPGRVMIFGESAGATSMSLHLVMEENEDLYHAVAIDSGAFNQWAYRSWDDAMDIWENVTGAFGCGAWAEPLDCMLTKTREDLLAVSDAYYGNATGRNLPHPEAINGTQWGPVVDGVLLPQSPLQMLAEGQISKQRKKVPVLMGSNADEGTTFLSQGASSAAELAEWCNHTFGPAIGGAVAAFYSDEGNWDWEKPSPDNPGTARQSWDDAAQAVIGDFVMWCPARSAATALAKAGLGLHPIVAFQYSSTTSYQVSYHIQSLFSKVTIGYRPRRATRSSSTTSCTSRRRP
jgi:para-nitrobenzyl esterase